MGLSSFFDRFPRAWRYPRVVFSLMLFELALCIPSLALSGIANPDLYRTRFWQEGANHGWNSNPNQLIYAMANYRTIQAPWPWREFTTKWSFVISILTVFILLVKGIMFITDCLYPIIGAVILAGEAAIWAVAIYNQAAPDTSDPLHPQKGAPWYITKSCGPPVSPSLLGYCRQAKANFAVTILMCTLFTTLLTLALASLYPTKSFRESRRSAVRDNREPWEMLEAPRTPGMMGALKSPTTPRTKAFNTLSGNKSKSSSKAADPPQTPRQGNQGIQLRHHISMGNESYVPAEERS